MASSVRSARSACASRSWKTLPVQRMRRVTESRRSAARGSSKIGWNVPSVRSDRCDEALLARSRLLGVKMISGPLAVGQRLLAQQVEVVRGRAAVGDADVVLGRRLQEALDAGRGVLGPVALVAVRQQQGEPRGLAPLGAPGHDELVDHDLGAVDEVAVLGLPQHQRLGRLGAVAVLEAHRGRLGERAVVQLERGRRVGEVGQGRVDAPGVRRPGLALADVVQLQVALAEGAARRVLAGEPDRDALGEQRRERQRLGVGPGDAALVAEGVAAARRAGGPAWGGS